MKKIIKTTSIILTAAFIAQDIAWANPQESAGVLSQSMLGILTLFQGIRAKTDMVKPQQRNGKKGDSPVLINRQLLGNHPFQEAGVRNAADTGEPYKPVPLSIAEIYNYLVFWLREAHAHGLGLGKVFSGVMCIPKFSRFSVIFKRGNFRVLLIHFLPLFAVISLFVFIHWSGSDYINQTAGFITYYNEQISAGVSLAIDKIQPICSFSKNSLIITGFFYFLRSNRMLSDMLNIPFVPFKSGYMQPSLLLCIEIYFIRYLTKCQEEKALKPIDRLLVNST